MAVTYTEDWYNDPGNVFAFASAIHTTGEFANIDEVLDFFEKPYNHDDEFRMWCEAECPEAFVLSELRALADEEGTDDDDDSDDDGEEAETSSEPQAAGVN